MQGVAGSGRVMIAGPDDADLRRILRRDYIRPAFDAYPIPDPNDLDAEPPPRSWIERSPGGFCFVRFTLPVEVRRAARAERRRRREAQALEVLGWEPAS